jgi:hypothetical protein
MSTKRKAAKESKKAPKRSRGETVNSLNKEQLEEIVKYMKTNTFPKKGKTVRYVEQRERGWFCNLECTQTMDGDPKYPQLDLNRFEFPGITGKHLVHLIWWRWENNGANIADGSHISHVDKEPGYLALTQESVEMNESRKYCHRFGWYKKKQGEDRPRCPHWDKPCTGP